VDSQKKKKKIPATHLSVAVPHETASHAVFLPRRLWRHTLQPGVALALRRRALLVSGLAVEKPEILNFRSVHFRRNAWGKN
jgi:hypothetical protein